MHAFGGFFSSPIILHTHIYSYKHPHTHTQVRFFPKELVTPKPATYLDIILYSREQIRKENADMGNADRPEQEDAPWGIISVKAQDVDHELPMQPITMLRNALGREYGGSGVALDKAKYQESVDFWSKNAVIR